MSNASFTGLSTALSVVDALAGGTADGETAFPVKVRDLRELLRRYTRMSLLKEGAELKCETIRKWWFSALRNGSDFDPTTTVHVDGLGDATIAKVPNGADGCWVVALDGEELHTGGSPEHAYLYFCGLLTGAQYGDGS